MAEDTVNWERKYYACLRYNLHLPTTEFLPPAESPLLSQHHKTSLCFHVLDARLFIIM